MYNLLIAFAAGVLVTIAVRLAGLPLLAGVIPGVLIFVGAYILLARRVAERLKALVTTAQKELQSISSPREQAPKVAKAVKILEQGLQYDRWQIMVASQVHGQIGILHYMTKDYAAAEPHLTQASSRDPMSQAMLGALHYQRKQYGPMTEAFERAVKAGKKEGLVWAVYAWCLQQTKERDKAIGRPRPRRRRQPERREAEGRPHRAPERQADEDEALGTDVVAVQPRGPSPGFRGREAGSVPASVSRRAGVSSCSFPAHSSNLPN